MKKIILLSILLVSCILIINCFNNNKVNNNILESDKYYISYNDITKEALIFKKKTYLYENINFKSKKLYNFKTGEKINIIGCYNKVVINGDNSNIWYQVKFKDHEGWIYGSDIGFLPFYLEDGYLLVNNEIKEAKEFFEKQYVYKIKSNLIYYNKKDFSYKKLLSMKEYGNFQIKNIYFNDFNKDGKKELILISDIEPISTESHRIYFAYNFTEGLKNIKLLFYWYDIVGGDNSIAILNNSQFNKNEISLDYIFSFYGGDSITRSLLDIKGTYYQIKLLYNGNNNIYSIKKIELESIKYKDTPSQITLKDGVIKLDTKNIESRKKNVLLKEKLTNFLKGTEKKDIVRLGLDLVEPFIYDLK